MELNVQRQPVAACELLLDAAAEHPIECDILLPDYCPDIVRVLSCQVTGAVTDAAVRGGAFAVEGMATVTLCYLGEVGGMRKTEYRLPFSKTFELAYEPQAPVYTVTAEQGYINCRAVSKRRLDVRGTLILGVKVYDTASQQAVCAAEGGGVQLRLSETQGVRVGDQVRRQFTLREEVSPGLGRAPVAEIVRADARAVAQEARVVAGRVVLKGELLLHLLYKTDRETGALDTADFSLPISQLLDISHADDDAQCEASLTVASLECVLDDDSDAEAGSISVDMQIVAQLQFFHAMELVGAVDSYSTLFVTETQAKKLRIPRLQAMVSERSTLRCEAAMPEELRSIVDVWAMPQKAASGVLNGMLTASCQVVFTVLAQGDGGLVDCFTHTCEASVPIMPLSSDAQFDFAPRFSVLSSGGSVSGGRAQLSCELMVTGTVLGFETRNIITELRIDETRPKKSDPAVGLYIYYARAGETVWDISKRYGSLPAKVMEDNGLDDEVIASNTALIIPTA